MRVSEREIGEIEWGNWGRYIETVCGMFRYDDLIHFANQVIVPRQIARYTL